MKKRSIASSPPPSSGRWISVSPEVIASLTLSWPCSRPQTLKTSPPKRLWPCTSPHHSSRPHSLRSENGETSDRKICKEKKQGITSELEKTSKPPALPVGLARTWVISPVSTVTRRVTTQLSLPSLKEEEATSREARKDSTPVTSVNVSGTYGEAWKDLGQVIQWWWEGTLLEKLFQTQERRFRRLVTVSATFTSMTEAKEATLQQLPYIRYPIQFREDW